MKKSIFFIAFMMAAFVLGGGAKAESKKIQMSLDDSYVLNDSDSWNVKILKYLSLRAANVSVEPKKGNDFSLMLYFKCDTADIAKFNTPEKIKESVVSSSQKYLPYCVEKKIVLKKIDSVKRYGFYTLLSDKKLISQKNIPAGEYKYMIRGMLRLSDDSVLGFSLMINDIESKQYKDIISYISSFEK